MNDLSRMVFVTLWFVSFAPGVFAQAGTADYREQTALRANSFPSTLGSDNAKQLCRFTFPRRCALTIGARGFSPLPGHAGSDLLKADLMPLVLRSQVVEQATKPLVLTASNLIMHAGDLVPPLAFSGRGYTAHDNWAQAVTSGSPLLSTKATKGSLPGIYAISISAGSMKAAGSYSFSFVPGTLTILPADQYGATLNDNLLYGPNFAMNVKTQMTSCGRVFGDGATDDTAAIRCLLEANRPSPNVNYGAVPHTFYFPQGVYILTDSLVWNGDVTSLYGEGPQKTIFRVPASTAAFLNADTPGTLISYPNTNQNDGFANYFTGIGIDVGPGNPGIRALDFFSNNRGSARNVQIWSEDGQGVCGFCSLKSYPGPALISNVAVYGFKQGFTFAQNEYNMVGEGITVENQTGVGITSAKNGLPIFFRRVLSYNSVTAFEVGNSASVLMNAELLSSGGGSAITSGSSGNGVIYLRDIHTSGYTYSLVDKGAMPATTAAKAITEYWTSAALTLFSKGVPHGLFLPVKETPEPKDDPNPSNWTALSPDLNQWAQQIAMGTSASAFVPVLHNYGAGGTIQTANDGGFTGLYDPAVMTTPVITIPDTLNHLAFDSAQTGNKIPVITLVVAGSSPVPFVLDHFYGHITINHTGSRAIVVKDGALRAYTCSPGAGDLYFDDAGLPDTTFCSGQHIWARQLNNEGVSGVSTPITAVGLTSGSLVVTAGAARKFASGDQLTLDKFVNAPSLNGSSAYVTSVSGNTLMATMIDSEADITSSANAVGTAIKVEAKMTCTGCTMWVFGYKTEHSSGATLSLTNGKAEFIGGFHYALRPNPTNVAVYQITDSDLFTTFENFQTPTWSNWVIENRHGVTKTLVNPNKGTGYLNMFYSNSDTSH